MTDIGKTLPTAWDAITSTPKESAVLKAGADLTRGKFNLFGLDHLATMLARAGRQAKIRAKNATPRKTA